LARPQRCTFDDSHRDLAYTSDHSRTSRPPSGKLALEAQLSKDALDYTRLVAHCSCYPGLAVE